METGQKI